jgi:hypothetical protein
MTAPGSRVVMLDPTLQVSRSTSTNTIRRLDSLAGKTIGVIWNNKIPGDALFERMLDALRTEYSVIPGPILMKPYLGNVAPNEFFDELQATCDAVVTGIGD